MSDLPENILNLSDDELDNLDLSQLDSSLEDTTPSYTASEAEDDDDEADTTEDSSEEEESQAAGEDSDGEAEEESEADGETSSDEEEGEVSADDEDTQGDEETDTSDDTEETEKTDDAKKAESDDGTATQQKEFYDRITAPFKANGREMRVQSADEAIQLMQMGANYNKKMAALKPSLKVLKTLEKHELLDETKLGYLIDLHKKDPAAIRQLLKDSGMDPMDMDLESDTQYKPNTYTTPDSEVDLDMVLEELKDSPTYDQTLDVVANKWDGASRQIVSQSPQTLKVLNDHLASGVYDVIADEMARQRALGRLAGMSDIESYRQVGDEIAARNGFAHLAQGAQETEEKPAAPKRVPPKPVAKKPDPALNQKKRAASPAKPGAPATPLSDLNPLAMPDDEFEKVMAQFL